MVKRKRRVTEQKTKRDTGFSLPANIDNLRKPALFGFAGIIGLLLLFYVIIPLFDAEEKQPIVQEEEEPAPAPIVVTVLNGCGVSGIAAQMTQFLENNGYRVYETKNANNLNYAETVVEEKRQSGNRAKMVADLIGLDNIAFTINESDSSDVIITLGKDYVKFKPFRQ